MNTEKPEPPPGMRIMSAEELKNPLPMDAVSLDTLDQWKPSSNRGRLPKQFDLDLGTIYATRTSIPSPEHNPDGLTPEQYRAPEWRLLKIGEDPTHEDEWFSRALNKWIKYENYSGAGVTYRRRATPIPATASEKPEGEAMERATCTLCCKVESSGFFTGCMIRDIPKGEVNFNWWQCDGDGNLTRPAATPPAAQGEKDAEIARLRADLKEESDNLFEASELILKQEADLATVRAKSAAKDAIIGELVGLITEIRDTDVKAAEDLKKLGMEASVDFVPRMNAALARAEEAEKKGVQP